MTQEMRLLSVEQLRFVSDTAYGAGVRASQDELRRLQSVETESKERILRLEGALVKEVAINVQLLEALEWIANRCPEQMLKQPLHIIHQEAAYDAGACARAAIAVAKDSNAA
jgi:hypothetical protein